MQGTEMTLIDRSISTCRDSSVTSSTCLQHVLFAGLSATCRPHAQKCRNPCRRTCKIHL